MGPNSSEMRPCEGEAQAALTCTHAEDTVPGAAELGVMPLQT